MPNQHKTRKIAVIGSGPSGLMAAHAAAQAGAEVSVFERRSGLGRKLLIAGSSGLNISHDASVAEFLALYRHTPTNGLQTIHNSLEHFPPTAWIEFIQNLGHETFIGTSGRWFVKEMKASKLLQSWVQKLRELGVSFYTGHELIQVACDEQQKIQLEFSPETKEKIIFDACILALGGGSWESPPPAWPAHFRQLGLVVHDFTPSNVGFEVTFPPALLREAEGQPIKNCIFKNSLGEKQGELILTQYGLEGTPIYFFGTPGMAILNLKPEWSLEFFLEKLNKPLKENFAPFRRLQKLGGLCPAAQAMVFHLAPPTIKQDLAALAQFTQAVPIELIRPRPLAEAISSRGGVDWNEVNPELMLRKFPGIYVTGEMLDWDAPTGGFLIQTSVSLGAWAGKHACLNV